MQLDTITHYVGIVCYDVQEWAIIVILLGMHAPKWSLCKHINAQLLSIHKMLMLLEHSYVI